MSATLSKQQTKKRSSRTFRGSISRQSNIDSSSKQWVMETTVQNRINDFFYYMKLLGSDTTSISSLEGYSRLTFLCNNLFQEASETCLKSVGLYLLVDQLLEEAKNDTKTTDHYKPKYSSLALAKRLLHRATKFTIQVDAPLSKPREVFMGQILALAKTIDDVEESHHLVKENGQKLLNAFHTLLNSIENKLQKEKEQTPELDSQALWSMVEKDETLSACYRGFVQLWELFTRVFLTEHLYQLLQIPKDQVDGALENLQSRLG